MSNNSRFIIGQWCNIPKRFLFDENGNLNTERLDENIDAGMNLIPVSYGYELNKKVIEYCRKKGVMCSVTDGRIMHSRFLEDGWSDMLDNEIAKYVGIDGVADYHIQDEPHKKDFDGLAKVTQRIKALDPNRIAYINLFPNYASKEQLGHDTYYEHVEDFIRTVKPELISYDHYHFIDRHNTKKKEIQFDSERERLIYEDAHKGENRERYGFFDNLIDVRELSQKYDIPFMIIILVTEHGRYRDLTEAEIRWEVYQSLTFGAKGISYFTYWTPGYDEIWQWDKGLILTNGERTQHYYDVQKINAELKMVGELLYDKSSLAVYNIGTENEKMKQFEPFGSVNNIVANKATVGFFDDDIMLIANRDYDHPQVIRIDTDRNLQIFDKSEAEWKSCDKLITLAAGDGEVFRTIAADV